MSTPEANATRQRTRSPNYPGISLAEAIPRIDQIYQSEFNHAADSNTLAQAMGYSGSNGASDVVISALKKYGWLENAGQRQYRLSEAAIDVCLHQKGEPERAKAIREAAFTPPLFKELHDEYGEQLPSENNLRVKLIKKGFNPRSVGDVIHAYRETLELVSEEAPAYTTGGAGKTEGKESSPTPAEARPMQQPTTTTALPAVQKAFLSTHAAAQAALGEGESVLAFKLSRESEARVIFSGQVTQEAIDKLAALLNLSKDAYPTKAELEQPRRATWRNKDHDQPVTVTGEAGVHEGRRYMTVEGSDTAVPEDELEYQ